MIVLPQRVLFGAAYDHEYQPYEPQYDMRDSLTMPEPPCEKLPQRWVA